jgi:beta-galactosidase
MGPSRIAKGMNAVFYVVELGVVQDLVADGWTSAPRSNWSFVDNLEWVEGYDLQFGLYGSDPTTPELERTPMPASIDAISAITKDINNSLPLNVLALYIPGLTV